MTAYITRQATLSTPGIVSALQSSADVIAVGGADGSVRFYKLPETRVHKAIKGLGGEVTCMAFSIVQGLVLYVAVDREVYTFDISCDNMILSHSDASNRWTVTQKEDDAINQIDVNKSHLCFCCDSGVVGTIELATGHASIMSESHEQIAFAVSWVPGTRSQLLSGGYDSRLLHFEGNNGRLLSHFDIREHSPPVSEGNVSLAPPFIQCLSISPHGVSAACTANGLLVLGMGSTDPKAQKTKKWDGLAEGNCKVIGVADGPIVGVQWLDEGTLLLVTLKGTIKRYTLDADSAVELSKPASTLFKVNAMVIHRQVVGDEERNALVLGGMTAEGKGVVEVYMLNRSEEATTIISDEISVPA